MNAYTILKFIHILAVIVFLGDIIVTAYWKWHADKTGNPVIAFFSQRLVILTDRVLLIPSIVVLMAAGYANAAQMGIAMIWSPGFLIAQILFALCGLIWFFALRPIQSRQLRIAQSLQTSGGDLSPEFFALSRSWFGWGLLTVILPLGSAYFMVRH